MDLSGVLLPAVTPFDRKTGNVDVEAACSNLRAWLLHPIRGVILAGSTGEGVLLEEHERRALLLAAREVVPADRCLVMGTGGESTRITIQRCSTSGEMGADAVLVQPPAFYRPAMTPEALAGHYRAVADASPVPVILYQVPLAYSTLELPTGLVVELSGHENIIGIKDSRGSLDLIGELVESCRDGFQVLSGRANTVYASLEVGAVGAVLALANADPARAVGIVSAFAAGRDVEAGRLQEGLSRVHDAVAPHGVGGIKAAVDLIGLHGGDPRPPLRPLPERARSDVRKALEEAVLAPARVS